jgi:diguanylate cyclase (GGDEF)-like protein/PAS domain S-box-containing protein
VGLTTGARGWLLAHRPGLRAAVLALCGGIVAATALTVSVIVADQLRSAATAEAVGHAQAVVTGVIGPHFEGGELLPSDPRRRAAIDAQLESLVGAGRLLRIKIWDPAGTVVYSDLAQLRGRNFGVADDLAEALAGDVAVEYSAGDDEENVFEHGLAERFVSMYLPIRSASGQVLGAYELYEDAGPIEAQMASTRDTVLLLVGGAGIALLTLLFVAFSVTARWLARRSELLTRSERRFRSLVRNSADVNLIVDAAGVVQYESPSVKQVMGYAASDRIGRSAFELIHPDDRGWAAQLLADVQGTPGHQLGGELRARHADGSWRRLEVVLTNLAGDPAVGGVVVNYRDVTERRALEEELRHQALHDSLTGLANRALFVDRLEHALSRHRRSGHSLAVMLVDLDDFKTVNDSLGHSRGDQLLKAFGQRLVGLLRGGDTIARLGGDEFCLLVEEGGAGTQDARDVGERLLDKLSPPFELDGDQLFVRASIGVARWSAGSAESAEDLIRNADASVNAAKAKGKNRVEVFEPGMHTAARARLALKGDLERALERDEFFVRYQPIFHLADERLVGVEALLRWRHPERGVVEPAAFLPVLEETGLIVAVGQRVLELACRQVRTWDRLPATRGLSVSVNVSALQVNGPDFASSVRAAVRSARLAPQRVTLEFTESALIFDSDQTLDAFKALKRDGFRLSIDDFGTGYSSLSYLQRLPIDELKVDRSFVAGVNGQSSEQAVVRSVVELAQTLGMATVAEGIERGDQLERLREIGASFGQGFFFAPALDAIELESIVLGGVGWPGPPNSDARLPGASEAVTA